VPEALTEPAQDHKVKKTRMSEIKKSAEDREGGSISFYPPGLLAEMFHPVVLVLAGH
jgi:hypothetical protein